MKDLFNRAIGIYCENGLVSLAAATARFVYWNLGVRRAHLYILYTLSGQKKSIRLGGTESEFRVRSLAEFDRLRNLKGEADLIEDLLSELTQDDIFFDIGANTGTYSCFVGKNLEKDHVVAFEPHPANVSALEENLAMNNVDASVHQIALSDTQGKIPLQNKGDQPGEGKHSLAVGNSEDGSLIIQTVTMDSLVTDGDVPAPNVVKIDVEGAEMDVLSGGVETLKNGGCRVIYCEMHPDKMGKFDSCYQEVVDLMQDLGFDIEVIDGSYGEYSMIKAKKKSRQVG